MVDEIHTQRNNCECPTCKAQYLVAGLLPRKTKEDCAEGMPKALKIWCEKCQCVVIPKRINHKFVE